jgi:hypothetical protein
MMTALAALCAGGCDPISGVSRTVQLRSLPARADVEAALRATPGVEQVGYRQGPPSTYWSLSDGVVHNPPYDSFNFSGIDASATLDISENGKGEKTLRMYYLRIGMRLSREFVDRTRAMMDAAYESLRVRVADLPPADEVEEKLLRVPRK